MVRKVQIESVKNFREGRECSMKQCPFAGARSLPVQYGVKLFAARRDSDYAFALVAKLHGCHKTRCGRLWEKLIKSRFVGSRE